MQNVNIINHPLMQHKLTRLRNKQTESNTFRKVMSEMSSMLAYECSRNLSLTDVEVETPFTKTTSKSIEEDVILATVLRAGEGMLGAFLDMMPFARAGHVGIYRDKFIGNTVEYYFKLPEDSQGKTCIILDPMIATGDTAVATIDRLKQYGIDKIKFATIAASEQGIAKVHEFHADVEFYCATVEKEMSQEGYLLPGIGDAGNRLFKTK